MSATFSPHRKTTLILVTSLHTNRYADCEPTTPSIVQMLKHHVMGTDTLYFERILIHN